jgi:hypothetical protein
VLISICMCFVFFVVFFISVVSHVASRLVGWDSAHPLFFVSRPLQHQASFVGLGRSRGETKEGGLGFLFA